NDARIESDGLVTQNDLFYLVKRIRQEFGGGIGAGTLKPTKDQKQHDEDAIDQRDGRLEKVVIIAGDELAQLIDEGAETNAPQHCRAMLNPPTQKSQQQNQGDKHQQAAPQEMRNVQSPPADLREPCQRQEEANGQDRDDSGNKKLFKQRSQQDVAWEPEWRTQG